MLRLYKVQRQRIGYYLEPTLSYDRARSGLIEKDGEFLGSLATKLGLIGLPADAASLPALLDGIDPRTGEILDPRHARVRNVAFDCTFAAPKSVSLLHALGPREVVEQVAAGHETSVLEVLGYLERHAARVRRQVDRHEVIRPSPGFVGASFLHRTSRAQDPHLHSHVLIANLGLNEEGIFSALDARSIFEHLLPAGALYRSHLRYELSQRLGVSWRAEARGFADLIGLPVSALRAFSQRQIAIEKELLESGRAGHGAMDYAAARTRPEKRSELSYEQLREVWRERAFSLGVAESRFTASVSKWTAPARQVGIADSAGDPLPPMLAREAVAQFDRPFSPAELVQAVASALSSGSPVAAIEAAAESALARDLVISDRGSSKPAFFSKSGARIPRASQQERYVSRDFADRSRAVRDLLAGATELSETLRGSAQDLDNALGADLRGIFVVSEFGRDPLVYLRAIRHVAEAASQSGRKIYGIAPNERSALEFEALTGIDSMAVRRLPFQLGNAVVVSAQTDRLSPTQLLQVSTRTERQAALICLSPPMNRHFSSDLQNISGNQEDLSPRQFLSRRAPFVAKVGNVRVVQCGDAAALSRAVGAMVQSLERGEKQVAVVGPNRALLHRFGARVLPSGALYRALRAQPDLHLVVIGGASALGTARSLVKDERRIHFAVERLGTSDSARWSDALALGEPEHLRKLLGHVPADLGGRANWRVQATALERAPLAFAHTGHAFLGHERNARQLIELGR